MLQRLAVITAGTAIYIAINTLAWTAAGFALVAALVLTVFAIDNRKVRGQ